eukprot:TRINITY_DN394_c1_g1_i1.p1 TRINITY_DN394_c1_g1~~TRINITY_DN394_c1_g1_i1.p1  ORF type:complete len:127 (+),score=31.80 TRINITY_DN394_c1_g1_i1:113-493(+)
MRVATLRKLLILTALSCFFGQAHSIVANSDEKGTVQKEVSKVTFGPAHSIVGKSDQKGIVQKEAPEATETETDAQPPEIIIEAEPKPDGEQTDERQQDEDDEKVSQQLFNLGQEENSEGEKITTLV